jgi:DNA-binding SARP family transcriptional activator
LLLVAEGRVVPAEQLAEELWEGSPPPGAAGTLRSHVSRLRALTGPDAALIARGGGYALAAGPDQLDAARFERLAGAGREALEHGEAAEAAARLREALGLWRGRALADVAGVEVLAREGARLEELRLVAVEGRIEADIELGLAAQATGELEGLVAEHPLRERLWRLLVLALYRCGRQGDALAAYRRARAVLAGRRRWPGLRPGCGRAGCAPGRCRAGACRGSRRGSWRRPARCPGRFLRERRTCRLAVSGQVARR